MAQGEGAEIPRRAREVDIVVGPQAYHRLPALVAEAAQGKRAIDLDPDFALAQAMLSGMYANTGQSALAPALPLTLGL